MEISKSKRRSVVWTVLFVCGLIILAFTIPTTIEDFFLPGSQPLESGKMDGPSKCSSCHGGYDKAVEPYFNWTGSMMAQAQRDPLYLACLAISNQDVPSSGDLCIRCHTPEGWLAGRSIPTDGLALLDSDQEGVHCGFCHRLVRPAQIGENSYPGNIDYTRDTYPADQIYLQSIVSIPVSIGNGSYIVDSDGTRRGPFTDPGAKHTFFYSPFHSESAICGTCHDVSNPAFSKNPDGTYSANDFDLAAPSFYTYDMFPVERTYSEWLMSDYNTLTGVYAPQFGGNKDYVSTCQDCHMKDISGVAASQASAVFRNNLPHHDLTGGNTFMPEIIKTLFPAIDAEALDSGIVRARYMLQNAATLDLSVNTIGENQIATVKVTNETGHKLPSGYPEGRRLWINFIAKNESGVVIYESGAYDSGNAVLTHDSDVKVYEIKPGMDSIIAGLNSLPEGPSFHFVLNNKIFSDNRIPPRGFTNSAFEAIQSQPVNYTYADGQYWDETEYILPAGTREIEVFLYYQTLSREYVEFLKNENVTNNAGQVMYDLWLANGKSSPELMTFTSLQIFPTNVNDEILKNIKIYPNPATDNINISFSDYFPDEQVFISLINSSGQYSIRSQELSISGNIGTLDISKNTPGNYIYLIENKAGSRIASGNIIIR